MLIGADNGEVLPAASNAATAYAYVVEGLRPVSAYAVVAEVPICVPFRNTL